MNLTNPTDMLSNTLSQSANENEKFLGAYNEEIKPKGA